jgi:hypothetical protein
MAPISNLVKGVVVKDAEAKDQLKNSQPKFVNYANVLKSKLPNALVAEGCANQLKL